MTITEERIFCVKQMAESTRVPKTTGKNGLLHSIFIGRTHKWLPFWKSQNRLDALTNVSGIAEQTKTRQHYTLRTVNAIIPFGFHLAILIWQAPINIIRIFSPSFFPVRSVYVRVWLTGCPLSFHVWTAFGRQKCVHETSEKHDRPWCSVSRIKQKGLKWRLHICSSTINYRSISVVPLQFDGVFSRKRAKPTTIQGDDSQHTADARTKQILKCSRPCVCACVCVCCAYNMKHANLWA